MNSEVTVGGESVRWERATIEKLLLAQVRERRAARRWRMLKSLIWIGVIAALVWALVTQPSVPKSTSHVTHTAMVSIKGEIAEKGESSAENILPAMRSALDDSGSKALVLLINSPGGSPVQAGLINDEIRRLRKKHGKPIYAVVEDTCASAAYYIASAADKIYVDKASIVGSIGVLMDGFGFVDTLDKLGVERRLMTAGANKGFLDPFSPQTDEQRKFAQVMLDQIHQQFINVVKQGRGDRLKENAEMFSGLFWTGDDAVALGLADKTGGISQLKKQLELETVDYSYVNPMNVFFDRFGVQIGKGLGEGVKLSFGEDTPTSIK